MYFRWNQSGYFLISSAKIRLEISLNPNFCFLYQFPDKYSLKEKIIEAVNFVKFDTDYKFQKKGQKIVQEKFTWEKRTKLILAKLFESKNASIM